MTNYDRFLSRAAERCRSRQSAGWARCSRRSATSSRSRPAIRQPTPSRGRSFRRSRASCSPARDRSVLQYGPTRGYRPLLEAIAGIMARARRADRARTPARHHRLAAGPRPRRARARRSRRRRARRAADLHRRDHRVPQRAGARWSACRRKPTASTSRRSTTSSRASSREGRRVALPLRRPELPESDRTADRPGQAAGAARVGLAPRRADRRGRPVPRAVLRRLGDRSRTCARCKADDVEQARHLSEQLLEDARARLPRRLDRRRRADCLRSWRWPSSRKTCSPGASISG